MSINPIVAAAINCAAHGWRVGPLCHRDPSNPRRILHPRGKDPVGYLVPHGVLDFTTDIATVIRWWSRWPWNIGAAVPRAGSSSTSTGPTVGRTPAAGCRPSPSWRALQSVAGDLHSDHWQRWPAPAVPAPAGQAHNLDIDGANSSLVLKNAKARATVARRPAEFARRRAAFAAVALLHRRCSGSAYRDLSPSTWPRPMVRPDGSVDGIASKRPGQRRRCA
jgi:hypothetical protein